MRLNPCLKKGGVAASYAKQNVSNEQNPGYLYIGDYTTQLCGEYNRAL